MDVFEDMRVGVSQARIFFMIYTCPIGCRVEVYKYVCLTRLDLMRNTKPLQSMTWSNFPGNQLWIWPEPNQGMLQNLVFSCGSRLILYWWD